MVLKYDSDVHDSFFFQIMKEQSLDFKTNIFKEKLTDTKSKLKFIKEMS